MKESAAKEMKPPARDNRAIRIKSVKAAGTRRKPSQKHSAVSAASATKPSKKCAVSRNNLVVGPRVIPINRSLGSAASRQQSFHSERTPGNHTARPVAEEEERDFALVKQRIALRRGQRTKLKRWLQCATRSGEVGLV